MGCTYMFYVYSTYCGILPNTCYSKRNSNLKNAVLIEIQAYRRQYAVASRTEIF